MRRLVLQTGIVAALALALAPAVLADKHQSAASKKSPYQEGKQYEAIVPPYTIPGAPKDKIIVQEFFWYGCPHCYELEPYLEKWEKPKDVEFMRLPASLGAAWQVHAYVYYTLQALDRMDLHPKFFAEIHKKKKRITTTKQITNFFAKHDVKKADVQKTMRSFLVDTQVKRADKMMRDYEIASVPYLVVNGRYKLSPGSTGGYSEMMDVVDYLVKRERKRLKKSP